MSRWEATTAQRHRFSPAGASAQKGESGREVLSRAVKKLIKGNWEEDMNGMMEEDNGLVADCLESNGGGMFPN